MTFYVFLSCCARFLDHCRDQKVKPFSILMKQKMMGWQWQQQDHKQIIGTSLQIDNHVRTTSIEFKFLQAGCPS